MMEGLLLSLSSHSKLDRDRGVEALTVHLTTLPTAQREEVEGTLLKLANNKLGENCEFVEGEAPAWEQVHGALQGLVVYINATHAECSNDFMASCLLIGQQFLSYYENRVRVAAGELLGALGKYQGVVVYRNCKGEILSGIKECLARDETVDDKQIKQKLNGQTPETVFHDTAGWGNLETFMKALQCIIQNIGCEFDECIDDELLSLVFVSLEHTNRFVRETGYMVCCALVSIHPQGEETGQRGHIWLEGKRFADALEKGLADNWSQVRMAACCAARAFLLGIPEEGRDEFFPQLLPPLCLNRYYIAEGVRIHCQGTWGMLFGVTGVGAVEKHLPSIVPFYIRQSEADNHAVREAACACIAELATKVGTDPVKEFVPDLIKALLVCFMDDSWPVRDAACVACGNFVAAFSVECECYLEQLLPLFYDNLEDNIPSVRHGAAIALTKVSRKYSENILMDMLAKLSKLLKAVDEQSDDSSQFSDLSKKPAVFGVAMADDPAHTNQVMYSCGSLAPKMKRGGDGTAPGAGGCSASHHFKRPAQPWETTDGGVKLLMELCDVVPAKPHLLLLVPKVSSATRRRNYEHHKNLLETIFKCLPVICRKLTKNKMKPFISDFLDGLYYSLKSDNNLLKSAAVECLQSLSLLLGPNILRGRIEMSSMDMLQYVEQSFPETIGA